MFLLKREVLRPPENIIEGIRDTRAMDHGHSGSVLAFIAKNDLKDFIYEGKSNSMVLQNRLNKPILF